MHGCHFIITHCDNHNVCTKSLKGESLRQECSWDWDFMSERLCHNVCVKQNKIQMWHHIEMTRNFKKTMQWNSCCLKRLHILRKCICAICGLPSRSQVRKRGKNQNKIKSSLWGLLRVLMWFQTLYSCELRPVYRCHNARFPSHPGHDSHKCRRWRQLDFFWVLEDISPLNQKGFKTNIAAASQNCMLSCKV